MAPIDVGLSASFSSGAQSGSATSGTGDFIVNSGGGLKSVLPTVKPDQAWIVWIALAAAAVVALVVILKLRK